MTNIRGRHGGDPARPNPNQVHSELVIGPGGILYLQIGNKLLEIRSWLHLAQVT
jgi:hypothetical protein